ncbi:hypothetical protein [Actinomyces vulturis]|uniref:hypothetical protein n=1 Tax=Actinomyces vulturis TaxID=1857645 RepID=UPI00083171A3|nr:hypothetical protein [Actinomyces vulturis]
MKRLATTAVALATIALCASCGGGVSQSSPENLYKDVAQARHDGDFSKIASVTMMNASSLDDEGGSKVETCSSGCEDIIKKIISDDCAQTMNDAKNIAFEPNGESDKTGYVSGDDQCDLLVTQYDGKWWIVNQFN